MAYGEDVDEDGLISAWRVGDKDKSTVPRMIIAKCCMNSDKCGLFRCRDKLLAAVSEFQMILLTDNDSN